MMAFKKTVCMRSFKRRKTEAAYTTSSPDWTKLHVDLWESVLKKLSFADTTRFKGVCSSWLSVAKNYITSLFEYIPMLQQPQLLFPSDYGEENQDEVVLGNVFLQPVARDKIVQCATKNFQHGKGCCLGSSHGWLIYVTDKADLFIFHPFIDFQIHLPSVYTLNCSKDHEFACSNLVQNHWIKKVVFSSEPISSGHNFGIVFMFGVYAKLAYTKFGDSKWTELEGANQFYSDIVGCDHHVYALSTNGSVESWDFQGEIPVKVMNVKPSLNTSEIKYEGRRLCTENDYIAKLKDDILLVVRCIGEFVDAEGNLYEEGDLLGDEFNPPKICPYMTRMFHVFKLDFSARQWVKLQDLGDRVLFLGGSQSVSLPVQEIGRCQENSIYFTDDYWERTDEDYDYGGHDVGVFRLDDGKIENFYEIDKMESSSYWVVH